jgi:N-ethylmaleimide reductase
MSDTSPTLFTPVQIGALTLPNRIVMAPMTRNRAAAGNVPGALAATYYAQRASAGLIISEAAQVMPEGQGYPATPGIHSDDQVAGWRKVTEAVHDAGGRMFLQLWHVGRVSHPDFQPGGALPVAPSAIRPAGQAVTLEGMKDFVTPRALDRSEIPGIIAAYRDGARNALAAGFDGVEVHGANGYLLDQFLRDGSNQRQDDYGGPVENRARLLLEVTSAVCEVWGSDRVGVRLSPLQPFNDMRDSDPEGTFSYTVEQLNPLNLAYLHVTEMGAEQRGVAGPSFDLGKLRDIFQGPYMTNAGYTRDRANAALAAGDADLVAFGVPYIANPDLVARFAADAPLNEADQATFYGGGAEGYTDYPTLEQ